MNRTSIYWLGLGSGLIIGAILIQLMSLGESMEPLDLTTIEEAAARNGYRLVKEDESAWIVEEKIIHSIYIPADMTDESIADWFASAGLIDSREAFLDALASTPGTAIIPGFYEIASPISAMDLVELLTTG